MATNPTTPDTLSHFYDLRALAMSASAMTLTIDEEGSDELNAIRRVLSCLADKALEFANEEDRLQLQRIDRRPFATGGAA